MNNSSYSLFLGDLSVFCNEADLEQLFAPFGTIVDIRIKQDMATGKKLSYGFVEFDNINSAIAVLKSMNGYVLCGRPMRIRWGANKSAKKSTEFVKKPVVPQETASVHVSFMVSSRANVTEESLRYVFSAYGFVVDATIKKMAGQGSNEGYGFVHYPNTAQGIESAITAVSSMNGVTSNGVQYKVGLSITLERKLNEMLNTPVAAPAPAPIYSYGPPAAAYPQYYAAGPAPMRMAYYAPPPPAYYAPPPPAYYANQPHVTYAVPPIPTITVAHDEEEDETSSEEEESSVEQQPLPTPAVEQVQQKLVEVEVVKAAPEVVHSIVLETPAPKMVCDSSCSCCEHAEVSSKVVPDYGHSYEQLQQKLSAARDDSGALGDKHSTLDVYMDVQEHFACIDIADY